MSDNLFTVLWKAIFFIKGEDKPYVCSGVYQEKGDLEWQADEYVEKVRREEGLELHYYVEGERFHLIPEEDLHIE